MSTIYTVNGKVLKNADNGKWLTKMSTPVDPYNPLGLEPYTMRVRLTPGTNFAGAGTAVKIDDENNIWDWTFGSGEQAIAMKDGSKFVEVLGINTHDVTDFTSTFYNCGLLVALPTNVYFGDGTNFPDFAKGCSLITSIPNYDLHSATNVYYAFDSCINVESGALAMYNQLAALGAQITSHFATFRGCGSQTVTGQAELAQIPADWQGED